MVLHIIHNKTGKSVIIDNDGQIQGNVTVTGDEPFKTIISDFLNKDIQIRYTEMLDQLNLNGALSPECIIKGQSGIYEIYKASDLYLTEYFVPKFCLLHGYTVATNQFNG
jgi:hypothetical protein